MGVLNLTPDSFSDGGRWMEPQAAVDHAHRMAAEGADLIDLGAESTRPGSAPVDAEEQWRRLGPVLERLAGHVGPGLSIDTASAEVARRALEAGAHVINDVTALRDPAMATTVAAAGAGVILMHMRGTPADMQRDPRYDDAPAEVAAWLGTRVAAARALGLPEARIAVDPGIGFGKRLEHNLALIARLEACAALGRPVVIGVSRKSFLGALLDLPADRRLEGGLAAAAIAVFQGAAIVRTHDVLPTVRAVRVAAALRAARAEAAGTSPVRGAGNEPPQ